MPMDVAGARARRDVTGLLVAWSHGDESVLDELMPSRPGRPLMIRPRHP